MTVTIIAIWAAAGWALAAFLGGYLIGRARDRPDAKNAKLRRRKAENVTRADGADDQLTAEWRNFLSYDGAPQAPIK